MTGTFPLSKSCCGKDPGAPAPPLHPGPHRDRDFYAFTRDSFQLEGYAPAPFEDKIPVAI